MKTSTLIFCFLSVILIACVKSKPLEPDYSDQQELNRLPKNVEFPSNPFQYYGGGANNRRFPLMHPSGRTSINKNFIPKEGDTDSEDDVGMEETPAEDSASDSSSGASEDGVSVSSEPKNPSVAEAKPVALAIAGEGGVASAKPVGTAVVGPGGQAVARPVGTAIAGVPGAEALIGISGSKKEKLAAASALKPTAKPAEKPVSPVVHGTHKKKDVNRADEQQQQQQQLYNSALQKAINNSSNNQLLFYPISGP